MRYIRLRDNIVVEIIPQYDPKFPNILPQQRFSQDFLNDCVSLSDDSLEIHEGMIYNKGVFEEPPAPDIITPITSTPSDFEPEPEDIEEFRAYKIEELNKAMNKAIESGVDVETSEGTEHFALTNSDQTDIKALYDTVKDGSIAGVPYHSEGNLCRVYSRDEITAIYLASLNHKTYHITYGNHICMWAKRVSTSEELKSITYGCTLPDDLNEHFKAIIEAMSSAEKSGE